MLTLSATKPVDIKAGTVLHPTRDIFKHVSPEGILEIESRMVEKKYFKRETIFLEDDPADFVWFVKDGHVQEVNHTADGKDIILCVAGAGGIFGASSVNGGNYGFHGVAETDATLLAFPVRVFQGLMEKYGGLARDVLRQTSRLLRHSMVMRAYAQETVERRLLHALMDLVGQYGKTIPLTRREIASMAGTSVETCIRVFTCFEAAGLIKSSKRSRLVVKNPGDLQLWLDRLDGPGEESKEKRKSRGKKL